MKNKLRITFLLLLVFAACNKGEQPEEDQNPDDANDVTIDAPVTITPNSRACPNAPNYGDSIVYVKPKNGGDFSVEPINNIGVQGTYLASPEGLKLNKNTGAINLSQSETGVRYYIAFIKKGTTDTCVSQLIVGGLTYMDAVYVLEQNDTLANPVFNADPLGASVCDFSDDTDYPGNNGNGNNRCSFDDDVPGQKANDAKLRVRTKSGIINLKKSVADGLFGKNPKNGDSKMVKIVYKLNDNSQKATQKLNVQMIWYDKATSIPGSLQQEVNSKRADMLSYRIVNGKPRPPLLIIAGLTR